MLLYVLLWLLCSFTGRRKEVRRESLPSGDLSTDSEADARRRPSFLRMVSLGKLKRESMSDRGSQEAEEETVEEEPVVKTREPLSGKNGQTMETLDEKYQWSISVDQLSKFTLRVTQNMCFAMFT